MVEARGKTEASLGSQIRQKLIGFGCNDGMIDALLVTWAQYHVSEGIGFELVWPRTLDRIELNLPQILDKGYDATTHEHWGKLCAGTT